MSRYITALCCFIRTASLAAFCFTLLVSSVFGANSKLSFQSERDGNAEIYTMNLDGAAQTNITNNASVDKLARWSPDGTRIAFYSERDGNSEIYTANPDGTGLVRVTNNTAGDTGPAWSPDSAQLVFASNRSGDWEIYTVNADGTNPVRLTYSAGTDAFPVWSPDGSKVLFHGVRNNILDVYVMNADGTNQVQLTSGTQSNGYPDWSPDGNSIVFSSNRNGNWDIYSRNADGSGQTRLTYNTVVDGGARWSPDGTKIAFHSDRDGNQEIYTMDADGANQTRITTNTSLDSYPAWKQMDTATVEISVSSTAATSGSVVINFNNYPDGTIITNQYPQARFSSAPGFSPVTNSLCCSFTTAPWLARFNVATRTYNHFAPQYVDFTHPVDNLVFAVAGINDYGKIANLDIYHNGGGSKTSAVINGNANTVAYADLGSLGYSKVTRIEIYNITDRSGLDVDDFMFTPVPPPPTPTPTPQPTPTPTAQNPKGFLDNIDADGIAVGWAADPDTPAQSINVHFYVDGAAGAGGTYAGQMLADVPRPDVNQIAGFPGNHGYRLEIPSQFRDGRQHQLYVHGIDNSGNPSKNVLLLGTPKPFTLGEIKSVTFEQIDSQLDTIQMRGEVSVYFLTNKYPKIQLTGQWYGSKLLPLTPRTRPSTSNRLT